MACRFGPHDKSPENRQKYRKTIHSESRLFSQNRGLHHGPPRARAVLPSQVTWNRCDEAAIYQDFPGHQFQYGWQSAAFV